MSLKFASGLLVLICLLTTVYVFRKPTNTLAEPTIVPEQSTSHKQATTSEVRVPASKPKKAATPTDSSNTPPAVLPAPKEPPPVVSPPPSVPPPPLQTPTLAANPAENRRAQIEAEIHILVNAARTGAGLAALSYSAALSEIAREHSEDMLSNDYFSHTDPGGCGMSCRFKKVDYSYWAIGENIYTMYGYTLSPKQTAEKIVEGWLKSPGHRANILSENFTTEGVGVAIKDDKIFATQDFAKPR